MLKGDLLVEISQAENKKEQIVLQTKAMHCFIRAKHLCRWILKQNGFEDQATDVVANGSYNTIPSLNGKYSKRRCEQM